jgi:cysteine-rich repeat protein
MSAVSKHNPAFLRWRSLRRRGLLLQLSNVRMGGAMKKILFFLTIVATACVFQIAGFQTIANAAWGEDVLVTNAVPDNNPRKPSMDEAPNGDLYIVVEDSEVINFYGIQVYKSTDGGETWVEFTGLWQSFYPFVNPSLAYAAASESWVFITFEQVHANGSRDIVFYRVDPVDIYNADFTTIVYDIYGMPAGANIQPEICTDTPYYDTNYYVYVTYSINDVDYYGVYFSRSTDKGLNWSAPVEVTGSIGSISGWQTQPDIAYGPSGLYIAFEKLGWNGSSFTNQVWVTKSTDFGSTWNTPLQLTASPYPSYHPRIAVASNGTVMVAYTRQYGPGDTDIESHYSTDGGTNWYPSYLPYTSVDEGEVELAVSTNNGRFHAAYWNENNEIWYAWTDTTNPELGWASPAITVNELYTASPEYPRPAVCPNPTLPVELEACVAWPDYRNYPIYDVYFDQVSTCGNGVLEGGEDCDDGNTLNGDCCSAVCAFEAYGSPCGNQDSTDCSLPNTCTADGFCSSNDYPAGTQCTSDGNMCTDDECSGFGVCLHYLNTDPCDDGNACTLADTCLNASCIGGPVLNCNDGNVCTTDSCNTTSGCVHTNNTLSCNDGLFCNGTDTCSAGSCSVHAGNPCNGGPVCNNTCNEAADNCFTANGIACTDEGNVCTNDICNGSGSCTHPNNTNPCNDVLFCNGTDTCNAGSCSIHTGNPCPAPIICDETTDTCSGADSDGDGIPDSLDNCIYQYNPGQEDADGDVVGDACDNCLRHYNHYQEDTYPPQTNGCGDACECEGNFDGDPDQDGTDAFTFKQDFGRSRILDPCTNADPCNGDFTCDNDVDGSDAFTFKSDFGRSTILNPCPYCVTIPWCVY